MAHLAGSFLVLVVRPDIAFQGASRTAPHRLRFAVAAHPGPEDSASAALTLGRTMAGDLDVSPTAPAAVIGGSGVDVTDLLDDVAEHHVETPYGDVAVEVGRHQDTPVAFLRRHGRGHSVPPHRVNYRANVWALAEMGVVHVVATNAVGSLHAEQPVGSMVVVDSFLDATRDRPQTFHDGGDGVVHVDVSDPYCPSLRARLVAAADAEGVEARNGGVYVGTEGPRFETTAEITAFHALGGDVVGMTGVPEVVLARELGLCYASLAIVTNLAAGLQAEVSHTEVLAAQAVLAGRTRKVIAAVLDDLPSKGCCPGPPEPVGG